LYQLTAKVLADNWLSDNVVETRDGKAYRLQYGEEFTSVGSAGGIKAAIEKAMEAENGGKPFTNIGVCGHSLGGGLATLAAAFASVDAVTPDLDTTTGMRTTIEAYDKLYRFALGMDTSDKSAPIPGSKFRGYAFAPAPAFNRAWLPISRPSTEQSFFSLSNHADAFYNQASLFQVQPQPLFLHLHLPTY
jgi:hypothetical protein